MLRFRVLVLRLRNDSDSSLLDVTALYWTLPMRNESINICTRHYDYLTLVLSCPSFVIPFVSLTLLYKN